MPSSYTSLLRLIQPAQGDLSGTWGDTINASLTALVDSAIAGTAAVTHDNTANYTLTANNGAADEARCMFLNITGTLTAARNVVCPTSSKLYFLNNATTGGYAVTLKTSGGTGVSVAAGDRAMLWCDATNVVGGITSLAGGITSLVFAAASAAAPSAALGTSTNGFYSSGTNEIGVSINGIYAGKWTTSGFTVNRVGSAVLSVVSSGSSASMTVDRPAGQIGTVDIKTSGLYRWRFGATPSAESGSNAGSDFVLAAYSDAGASLGSVFTVDRATQVMNVEQPIENLSGQNGTSYAASVLITPDITVPDATKPFLEVTTYQGGESKFGKWRQYHNVAEWGWGITYNYALDPYSVYPPATAARDVYNTTASSTVSMRFDVAEGGGGGNFWAIEWSPPSTTATVPDLAWGPDMFFYQGDTVGTSGASGGLLRITSSAGRTSGLFLESNNSVARKAYITRTTVAGAYEVASVNWASWATLPGASDGSVVFSATTSGVVASGGTLANVQRVVPISGATVTASVATEVLALDPVAGLAALTVVFPDLVSLGSAATGRKFTVSTFNTITALTLSASSTNISGPITTLSGGTAASWVYCYVSAGVYTWFRV